MRLRPIVARETWIAILDLGIASLQSDTVVAIAIIGGLIFATILTMVIVPVFYAMFIKA